MPLTFHAVFIMICQACNQYNRHAPIPTPPLPTQMLYNRNNFFIQELTYEPDPAKMDFLRARTADRIQQLQNEYTLMLYGSSMFPNETSSHYTVVTQPLIHSSFRGTWILFHTDECLCMNETDCKPESSPLYPDTRHVSRPSLRCIFTSYLFAAHICDAGISAVCDSLSSALRTASGLAIFASLICRVWTACSPSIWCDDWAAQCTGHAF
jgi:hypothetical protein